MSDTYTDGTGHDDGLENPMRFSIINRTIDIGNYLRHSDFNDKQVTEIEVQDGQIYVHWECAVDTDTDRNGGDTHESQGLRP